MDDIPEPEDTGGVDVVASDPALATAVDAFRKLTTWEQTVLAAQQLGIIVGVALLVGGGFILMVWIELSIIWVVEKCSKLFGKQTVKDPEDPAALVGSFKRYK
eukprot:TRINITY_DN16189_c0_g1_i1.p1 TRINITY_DN16189_c0_g1~~TRINITY_DN16189_c0_g1_i1.p1  ORF type:complete len:103 (+),score=30.38 TRINITY_DN16189_c0_g1_i1:190-498(+)